MRQNILFTILAVSILTLACSKTGSNGLEGKWIDLEGKKEVVFTDTVIYFGNSSDIKIINIGSDQTNLTNYLKVRNDREEFYYVPYKLLNSNLLALEYNRIAGRSPITTLEGYEHSFSNNMVFLARYNSDHVLVEDLPTELLYKKLIYDYASEIGNRRDGILNIENIEVLQVKEEENQIIAELNINLVHTYRSRRGVEFTSSNNIYGLQGRFGANRLINQTCRVFIDVLEDNNFKIKGITTI